MSPSHGAVGQRDAKLGVNGLTQFESVDAYTRNQ